VRVDEDAAQALDPEALDEAHPAHVCGKVVDFASAFDCTDTVVILAQVHRQALHAGRTLVPLGQWLLIDRANAREALIVEVARQCASDEAARASDDDEIILVDGCCCDRIVFHYLVLTY